MKNFVRFCLIICCIAAPFISHSQLSLGINGQINTLGAPLVIKQDLLSKVLGEGFNPGVALFAEYKFREDFALHLGLIYQQQSRSYLLTGSDQTINLSLMEYLRVPLQAKYEIPLQSWSITGQAGPYFGYALSLKSGNTRYPRLTLFDYESLDFEVYKIRRFDMGLLFGLGVEKRLAQQLKSRLSVGYHLGLFDIMSYSDSTFYHRGYMLDISFIFPFAIFRKQVSDN